jgi:uncharacterized membrane protein
LSSPNPSPSWKWASFLLTLNAVLQILDGVTTQIGLRYFGLVESNFGSSTILNAFGPIGLVIEKVGLFLLCVFALKYLKPRWNNINPVRRLEFVILLVGTAIIFAETVTVNCALILG